MGAAQARDEGKPRMSGRWLAAMAAGVVIVFGLAFAIGSMSKKKHSTQTPGVGQLVQPVQAANKQVAITPLGSAAAIPGLKPKPQPKKPKPTQATSTPVQSSTPSTAASAPTVTSSAPPPVVTHSSPPPSTGSTGSSGGSGSSGSSGSSSSGSSGSSSGSSGSSSGGG